MQPPPPRPVASASPRAAGSPRHRRWSVIALVCLLQFVPACAQTHAPVTAALATPAQLQARIERGLRRGEAAELLPLAVQAAAAHPQHAALQFLHGVVLMDLGRDDEALQSFTRFSQTWPELPDPLNNIALLHARGGRLEPALQALHEALRADPGHHAARVNLGHVHLALAVQAWETAAAAAALEPALAQRLQAARALVQAPGR